jgi:2-polyprenyl-6-methoxyphenol hydroxylase-like FAD-dependent oxidoreductase
MVDMYSTFVETDREWFAMTRCCVVGGGPAGMVLGLVLARCAVNVVVFEKHGDFLRDFRGDTVHASTLALLDELGLGERFAAIPHRLIERAQVQLDSGTFILGDLRRLPGPHKHIALAPQWDLLDLLADAGRAEPRFELRMNTEVTGLLRDRRGRVGGVRYRTVSGSDGELAADLVVACDGRGSATRDAAGLRARSFGTPMDVWWFRLPRRSSDPAGAVFRIGAGRAIVLIDRGDYWQCAYLIGKGSDARMRAQGIESLHHAVADLLPWLAEHVSAIGSWDDVKLLNVRLDRLRWWFTTGLLCIGDAAHAMSPVGGVGINLAVQDAVAAARILAPRLRSDRRLGVRRVGRVGPVGRVGRLSLARVQLRRWLPTAMTQGVQRLAHRVVIAPTLARSPRGGRAAARPPAFVRLLQRVPALQGVLARGVAIGVLPEHPPAAARRSPTTGVSARSYT